VWLPGRVDRMRGCDVMIIDADRSAASARGPLV
jgi:hypothetical protein